MSATGSGVPERPVGNSLSESFASKSFKSVDGGFPKVVVPLSDGFSK